MRIAGAIFVFCALGYVSAPFTTAGGTLRFETPAGDSSFSSESSIIVDGYAAVTPQSSCGPALIDAWHARSHPSGFFAYAPLTDATVVAGSGCRAESRHRLWRSAYAGVAALALVAIARRTGRPGPGLAPAGGAA